MKAAIYCRVSTEDQEREGTSLQSQLEACKKLADKRGYEVEEQHIIREVYSGLTIDRPDLPKLKDWIHGGEVDAVIIYDSDRFSRDGYDFVTLIRCCQKANVELLCVTEPIEHGPIGELLSFVRGWASMREADKIRERTMRGKLARALQGRLPSGRKLYGYDYIKGKGVGEGVRYVNESEAKWVKEVYRWLVEENLTINAITNRLRALGVPTPSGSKFWLRQSVYRILTNPAYIGKTYSFTKTFVEPSKRRKPDGKCRKTSAVLKPEDEWIEIPNATPAIISDELFEVAQKILRRNKELSSRNAKRQYLLSGYVFCQRCGRRYIGYVRKWKGRGKRYEQRYYRCGKSQAIVSPDRCDNRQLHAPNIEQAVWRQIETMLAKPEIVLKALEIQATEAKQIESLQSRLSQVETQLENRQKQKERIWRAFELTGDEGTFKQDIERLMREITGLENEKLELEHKIQSYEQYEIDAERIKEACQLFSTNLKGLTYEEKRFALEALQIRVLVDGKAIRLEGIIPVGAQTIVSSASRAGRRRYA